VNLKSLRVRWGSLRVKLIALLGLFILGASLAVGFSFYWQSRSALESELKKRGASLVKNLGYVTRDAVAESDSRLLGSQLSAVCLEEDVVYAFVQDAEGQLIASESRAESHLRNVFPLIAYHCWQPLALRLDTFTLPSLGRVYNFSYPVYDSPGFAEMPRRPDNESDDTESQFVPEGPDSLYADQLLAVVRVGIAGERTEQLVAAALKRALLVGLVSFGLGVAGLLVSLRMVVTPISSIAGVAKRISSGDFSARVELKGMDEIAELGQTLNEMARNLYHSQEEIRKASDDLKLSLEEKAELYRVASEKAARLEMLNELSRTMTSTLETPTLLSLVSRHLPASLGCDHCFVALYDRERSSFRVGAVFVSGGASAIQPGSEITVENTVLEKVMTVKHSIYTPDFGSSGFVDERTLATGGLVSGVASPIVAEGEFLGVVHLASIKHNAFASDQIELAGSVAMNLGLVLRNAELFSDLQRSFDELDRTQQKLTDAERLRQSEKLKAVGQMASGVAHDFNNMLASILGRVQLLKLKRASGSISDEEQTRWLEIIEKAALDGAETIKRIQQYGKEEVEKRQQQVDLNDIVRDALEITRPRWKDIAEQEGRRIELITDLGSLRLIRCVPSEIREVLTNIVFNAIDAMPEGGTLEIRSSEMNDWNYVSVRDSGIGMSDEIKKRIFEPFYTTKGSAGTGLGLSMVTSIVKNHRGHVELESSPGNGSCFTILLPIAGQPPDLDPKTSEPATASVSVLALDDEEMVRQSLGDLLNEMGHRVSIHADCNDGLGKLKGEDFDVVITDLSMPQMSGWDIAAEAKKRKPGIPVILLTGWGNEFDDASSRERGVDFVLAKPFTIDSLSQALSAVLRPAPAAK
jgi:signal transduction histidine kinase/ActR/RegA family two-component response regulator